MALQQTSLPFPVIPAQGRKDFIVGSCNQAALEWLDHPQKWFERGLIIYGPKGCGKTHLLNIFMSSVEADKIYHCPADLLSFDPDKLGQIECQLVVIDQLECLRDQTALYHLINHCREQNLLHLCASRYEISSLKFSLEDLNSRLKQMSNIAITQPDDEVLSALIIKHCSDRQIKISKAMVMAIVHRCERSFTAIHNIIHQLDELSLTRQKKISLDLLKKIT